MKPKNGLYHFIIDCANTQHIVLNDANDVVGEYTKRIFTNVGNYTKSYLSFLAQYELGAKDINDIRSIATNVEDAKNQLGIHKRLMQVDAWIENPKGAPSEVLERIKVLCMPDRKEARRQETEIICKKQRYD